jgi:hypothetical protein
MMAAMRQEAEEEEKEEEDAVSAQPTADGVPRAELVLKANALPNGELLTKARPVVFPLRSAPIDRVREPACVCACAGARACLRVCVRACIVVLVSARVPLQACAAHRACVHACVMCLCFTTSRAAAGGRCG